MYNVPIALELRGPLDTTVLSKAFEAIIERHEPLRTIFRLEDGELVQIVAEDVHPESQMEIVDLKDFSFDEADRRARDSIAKEVARPFNLSHGPVVRGRLMRLTSSRHYLLIMMHHIVADVQSCGVLLRELSAICQALHEGREFGLAPLELQYGDYAVWQRDTVNSERFEKCLAYWRNQLRPPIPILSLPYDRPRPSVQSFNGASLTLMVPDAVSAALIELCRRRRVTLFAAALAAYTVLLHRQTGQIDLLIGTPIANRSLHQLEPLIGLFLNTVVLRTKLDPEQPFAALLASCQQTMLDAINQEIPFERLVEELKPERNPSRSPLFQTMLTVQHGTAQPPLIPGIEVKQLADVTWSTAKFDLTVLLNETNGRITIGAEYNTDLFETGTVESLLNQLNILLQAVVANPDQRISALVPSAANSVATDGEELVEQFIQRLRAVGLRLSVEAGRLKVNAPKGVMDEAVKATIANRRAEIIATLSREGSKNTNNTLLSLKRIARTAPLPLSAIQRRFWFVDRFEEGRGGHNVAIVLRLEGVADFQALIGALEYVVMRHESLRIRIGERNDEPYPEIFATPLSLVKVADLADRPENESDSEAFELAREGARFDLTQGPVAQFLLIRISPDCHLVVFNMHHIVADGWSLSIAVSEFAACYSALTSGTELNTTDLPIQYVDYAAWEGEQVRGGLFDRQLAYWQAKLTGAPTLLELPTDRVRPAVQSFEGSCVDRVVDSDLADEIARYSRQRDVTPFMAILAALQVLLHRMSGQDDIVIGTPVANRGAPELENVIGPFVNSLALRVNLAENPTFNEFLSQVRQVTIDAIDNREIPFDLVVEAVNPLRTLGHAPIFQVMLALHNFPIQEPRVGELNCTIVKMETRTARFDLTVDMVVFQNKFVATYEYATDLFDRATIERLHDNLMQLLREVVKDDSRRLQELPLLNPNDERILLGDWNNTDVTHDRNRCVHGLFESTVHRTPDGRAVIVGDESFSYRHIDERANRLAHLLLQRKVVVGDRVAICLDRCVDMPVAMAAVLKAGAAYVPLDPTHPSERLRYTLDDAKTACVITHRRFATLFAETETLVLLDEVDLDEFAAASPDISVRPEDLAYIIYTSGSTGRPKGVQVEHHNLVSFLEAMRREPGLVATDVLLAVTTLAFDIAGLEIWLPFSVGASVVIASREDALIGERLVALLDRHQVTVMQATPSTWRLMVGSGWSGKADLKALCGGEALPRDLATKLAGRVYQLWNMYGPTETTIWSTISLVTNPGAIIPIGRPIANTRVYVLERPGLLAPIGAFGELAIAGEGVARGYWNRPELTAEKFQTLTLPDGRAERVYRTGDVVRLRNDGQLEFSGRRDNQVKLRGFRIELGEIEQVLSSHPGVEQCVVAIREDESDPQLVGYVVQSVGTAFDPDAARSRLRGQLPSYMVPTQFAVLPAFPLTPNGKIDRKALRAPERTIEPIANTAAEALMNPVQRRVADIWRKISRVNRVSLHDNFFDIGGHSMLIVKLHGELKREFDSDLALIELFQQTTVALQAERVSSAVVSEAALHRAQARAKKRLHVQ